MILLNQMGGKFTVKWKAAIESKAKHEIFIIVNLYL